MPKITFFMPGAYPLFLEKKGFSGGAELNLYNLAVELAKYKENHVDFLVGDYGQTDVQIVNRVRLIKIRSLDFPLSHGLLRKFIRRFSFFYLLIRYKSDVYIASTASEFLGYLVWLARFFLKKPVIFRLASDKDADCNYYKPSGRLMFRLYKYALEHLDVFVTQSAAQQALLKEHTGKESQIIKNGFFLKKYEPRQKEHFLWVARLGFKKHARPELLIKLARLLPEARFIMIFPGEKRAQDEVRKLAAGLTNIRFLESVPFAEIGAYFAQARCFINTSSFEGFPNTFIQAGLAETPILSFNVNPDGIIDKYQLGCFCHDVLETAYDFLKSLTDVKMALLGRNASAYVMQHHDITEKAAQYQALINKLAKN